MIVFFLKYRKKSPEGPYYGVIGLNGLYAAGFQWFYW